MTTNNESIIINKINELFAKSQEFLRPLVSASLFLQRFDYLILFLVILLFLASLFAPTNILGIIAQLIIGFSILKIFFVRGQKIELSPHNLVLIGFLAICFISIIFSPYTAFSYKGFLKTLCYIGFYFCMVQFFKFNKNKIVPVIFIIFFLITFESCFALIQSLNPLEAISTWQDTSYTNAEHILSRVYGTLQPYNPNLLGGYLITGLSSIITVIFWAVIGNHKKTLIISVLSLLATLTAIFLTGSRGSYLGIFGAIIIAILLVNLFSKKYFSQKAKNLWKKICISFITLSGCAILFCPAILKRILSIFMLRGDSSTSFRINVYQSSWQMFLDNWFSGIGVGNETFRNMYGLYMVTGFDALSAYSIYLEIAVESGIFALIFFIAFFIILIKNSLIFIKNDYQIEQKAIIISILIMLAGVFVHGLFDTIFFRPQLQFIFWTNIAIISVILENKKEYEKNSFQKHIQEIIIKLSNFVITNIKKITKGAQ